MTTRQRIYIGSATSTLIVFAIIEWLTGVFIAAPQQDFGDLAGIHPAIRLQINTAPIEREILNELENSGAFAPEFLVRAALPHGLSLWMAPDYERLMVEVRVLLQERRAGPLIARAID